MTSDSAQDSAVHVVIFMRRNLCMKHYLDAAEKAARAAGELLRQNFQRPQRVNASQAHDIKLEIDVQAQELITRLLLKEFPEARALRRRRNRGRSNQRTSMGGRSARWHRELFLRHPAFLHLDCVAFPERNHRRRDLRSDARGNVDSDKKATIPKLNGDPISRERARRSREAVVSVGLSKTGETIEAGLPVAPANGASRAQMPADGQRRARHGLCRLRTTRRLHRTGNQPVGHRSRLDSGGKCRRNCRNETARRT